MASWTRGQPPGERNPLVQLAIDYITISISIFTGHYTICCKKPQSCAPEDGQKFARNMLS